MVTQMGRRGTSWMFQQCAAAEVTWGHTAMSDGQKTRRVLLTWGSNSYGQLGLGGSDDTQRPQQVPELGEKGPLIKSISAGGGHSAAITDSGKLYVCGQNKSGQLGLGHYDDLPMLTLCTAILHIRVTKVSCGWDFSIILTDNGQLLSCGSNAYGQLGNSQQRASSDPKLIQNVTEKIVDIAAGLRHSLAVTENGQTLQWGSGLASHARRFCQGKTILAFYTAQQPCPVPGLENVKVKQVAAGSYHSVALSETGQVFTWGRSDYGQLGLGMSDTCANSQGNSKGKFKPPFCVTVLSGASQIACGSEHNLALCGNTVYSWGWNEHGMCGNGGEDNVSAPTAVILPMSCRVELIGCGAGHSMVLCTE
ncbi:secretion-regulating guanine nucleotide exchange factor isoform X3 [Hyla sarda]|uniref:secretion-regulating guanine nucleotide exchange factor isoform X3 n=1 Tax=Hyla sarda TaxID=327740 RepID=UPI0024C2A517|nr:secretion-regulating guanine nucleotide exchange factor isoform X3 [Hyla sarda]